MNDNAQERLNALLGIEPAEEATVSSELPPTVALDQASANIDALLKQVESLDADSRTAALLGGLATLVRSAKAEGPAVVAHLADQMLSHALARVS